MKRASRFRRYATTKARHTLRQAARSSTPETPFGTRQSLLSRHNAVRQPPPKERAHKPFCQPFTLISMRGVSHRFSWSSPRPPTTSASPMASTATHWRKRRTWDSWSGAVFQASASIRAVSGFENVRAVYGLVTRSGNEFLMIILQNLR
jgi:hypothetical protein